MQVVIFLLNLSPTLLLKHLMVCYVVTVKCGEAIGPRLRRASLTMQTPCS